MITKILFHVLFFFLLSERFGDGDTSGLDLDEVWSYFVMLITSTSFNFFLLNCL